MIRITFIIAFVLLSIYTNAQDADKTVSITVSGSGKTQDEAKQSALRSAIEQAFGAFISSKTEILNDQVVADQMASVSSGNIQSFSILNESQLPNGSWGITLRAVVSLNKLTSFVQSKGIAIEIKGGLFALNIEQQLLNEQGEIKTIAELFGILHETMQTSFDYVIKNGDPKSLDAESKNWAIPLTVTASANKNMDFCSNYLIKTLSAISLTSAEVESYKELNKLVFSVTVSYQGQYKNFFFRKETSSKTLNAFISLWEFYVQGFSVQSGNDQIKNDNKGILFDFGNFDFGRRTKNINTNIHLLTAGDVAGTFSFNDIRTLEQIKKMTEYSVNSTGVRSIYKYGGFVVNENLVMAIYDLGGNNAYEFLYPDAEKRCNELALNGFNDWRLPVKNEINELYLNSTIRKIIDLNIINLDRDKEYTFWWFQQKDYNRFPAQNILNGKLNGLNSSYMDRGQSRVRPVRSISNILRRLLPKI